MAGASHQTIRLTRGRHASREQGACAMELASLLAGERWSDRPRCVDPVIGAYVRALNDRLGHRERQLLVPYAARVVGTRRGAAATRACRNRCLDHATGSHRFARARMAWSFGVAAALRPDAGAGEWAARAAVLRGDVEGALALLDDLVRIAGGGLEPPPLALARGGDPQVGRAGAAA